MLRHTLLMGTLTLLVGSTLAGAAAPKVVGIISSVAGDSLNVKTRHETTPSIIKLDSRTEYIRWITARPWGQDNRADRRSLDLGRCVQVDLRSDEGSVAKRVWVNVDASGTLSDPCKDMR